MLISKENKYIFVSNPKTGTTAIQRWTKKNDTSAVQNSLSLDNRKVINGFDEHITPNKLIEKIGGEFQKYKSFVFIRNPYDKAVSGYFYYRNGNVAFNKHHWKSIFIFANIFIAKFLPFGIWVFLKPIKMNLMYIKDADSNILVNYIGIFERLEEDLREIMIELGFCEKKFSQIKRVNASNHKTDIQSYYNNSLVRWFFTTRYNREIKLYNKICSTKASFDWKGHKI